MRIVSNPIRENVQIATKLLFFGLLSIFEQNYYTKTKLKLQLEKIKSYNIGILQNLNIALMRCWGVLLL